MAGLLGNFDDEPQGLLGGLYRSATNPLTLAGLGLLSGEGFNGAAQGMRMGAGFDQMRQEQAQKKQFQGLLEDPSLTSAVPQHMLRIAQMSGPQGGAELLSKYLDPAREADLAYKKAQISKIQRDNALATQEAASKKALYDSFMSPGSQHAAVTPVSHSAQTEDSASAASRFVAPEFGSADFGAAAPQTPQDIFRALPPHKKAQAQIALARGDTEEFGKILGEGAPQIADNLTPGEKRVDQTFAKSYEDFVLSGGAADFDKNMTQLKGVLTEVEGGKKNLSGPVLGRLPDAVTAFTHPDAVDARQRVEEVVQRNLRIILGAQFTQKEGENLIARAYNPALDEAPNAKRLKRLISSMDNMKKAKMQAMDYFERHGTMKGFRGTTQFSVSDILADIDAPDQPNASGGSSDWSIQRID